MLTLWVNNNREFLDITFKSTKLTKECNDFRLLRKAYGERRAKLIRRRLDELRAADTLSEISYLPPPRMHQLKGNRKGQISLDLDHPYRLILTVADDPIPYKANGSLNLAKATTVKILGVEDTHE